MRLFLAMGHRLWYVYCFCCAISFAGQFDIQTSGPHFRRSWNGPGSCAQVLSSAADFRIETKHDMFVSRAQEVALEKVFLDVNAMLTNGADTVYARGLPAKFSPELRASKLLLPGTVEFRPVSCASGAELDCMFLTITAPCFFDTNAQVDRHLAALIVLAHEYAHLILEYNFPDGIPGMSGLAFREYGELFGDLIAVLYAKDGSAIANLLSTPDEADAKKLLASGLITDVENIRRGRNFMAKIAIDGWVEREEHVLLGPARSHIGTHYLSADYKGKEGKIVWAALQAIRSEVNTRKANRQFSLSVEQINSDFVRAMSLNMGGP